MPVFEVRGSAQEWYPEASWDVPLQAVPDAVVPESERTYPLLVAVLAPPRSGLMKGSSPEGPTPSTSSPPAYIPLPQLRAKVASALPIARSDAIADASLPEMR